MQEKDWDLANAVPVGSPGEQYRLLGPAFVMAIGSTMADRFEAVSSRHDTADSKTFRLKRARSDRQRPPVEALRLMSEIAKEIRQQ